MNLPSLPTDNLYKFMAIFGLLLVLFSFYWMLSLKMDISERLAFEEAKTGILDSESQRIYERIKLYKKIKADGADVPIEYLRDLENESKILTSETNKLKLESASAKSKFRSAPFLSLTILAIFGVVLVGFGFGAWYILHQKYIDAEIKWKGKIHLALLDDTNEKQRIVKEIIDNNTTDEFANN